MKTVHRRTSSPSKPAKTAGSVPAEPKCQYALRVSSGFNQGALVPVTRKKLILGRSFRACIPLEDDRVSREHAKITFEKGRFYLSDLESTNGTYLNNEQVTASEEIFPGDQIRIGNSIFSFETMKSKNPMFQEKFANATSVIPRAHFSFEDLAKIQPDRFRFLRRLSKPLRKPLNFLKKTIFNELNLIFVQIHFSCMKMFSRFSKAIRSAKLLK